MGSSREEVEVAKLWNENADRWTHQVRAGRDRFRDVFSMPMFLDFLPDLSGKRVLDAGCGEGHNTRVLARRGARMLGVDLSERLIRNAQMTERQEPLGIDYWVGSYTYLSSVNSGSCDAVVSTMAFMDGPDFKGAARESHRVLRNGGGLYFSVIHPCFMTRRAEWVERGGERVGRLVADYWNDQPYIEKWAFGPASPEEISPFTIKYFAYKLEDYVNALCDAGFRIRKIEEPRPTAAMVATLPALAPYRQHTPIFLFVAAEKYRRASG